MAGDIFIVCIDLQTDVCYLHAKTVFNDQLSKSTFSSTHAANQFRTHCKRSKRTLQKKKLGPTTSFLFLAQCRNTL